MGRRGESIYKRNDGRWEARYQQSRRADGTVKYRSVYGKTYREVKEKRRLAMQSPEKTETGTSFEAAAAQWLRSKEGSLKEPTVCKYRRCLDTQILPFFRGRKLSCITAPLVEVFLLEKKQNGRLDGTGGLSPGTLRGIAIVLQSILTYAYENRLGMTELIRIKKPKHERKSIQVLKLAEQERLERALLLTPHGLDLAIYLALRTGVRLGELCALRWTDLDLTERQLHVAATVYRARNGSMELGRPKTATSDRLIPLPDDVTKLLSAEKAQAQSELVFPAPQKGGLLNPRTVQYHLQALLKRLELPNVTFHTLRHTFATRWVECGLDLKSLSEILGHASVQITLDIYVHSSDTLKRDGIDKLAEISGHFSGQTS